MRRLVRVIPGTNVPFATDEAGETLEIVRPAGIPKFASLEQIVIHDAALWTKRSAEMVEPAEATG
jgi:hypothetical protein